MAYINFNLKEVVEVLNKNEENPDYIKGIKLKGETIYIAISPGMLAPKFEVCLTYKSFKRGKMIFDVKCGGPIKLLIKLMKSMEFDVGEDVYSFDGNDFTVDVNKYLNDKFSSVMVKEISKKGDEFTIVVVPD